MFGTFAESVASAAGAMATKAAGLVASYSVSAIMPIKP